MQEGAEQSALLSRRSSHWTLRNIDAKGQVAQLGS
jgi:hypothetical protein